MPTILDLFKTKQYDFTDSGKLETAEQHFAVRNSKDIVTESSNPLLKPAFRLRDRIQKLTSVRKGETLFEQETGGIRGLMPLAAPILYGTDIIRFIQRTTDSRDLMVRAAKGGRINRGLIGGLVNSVKNVTKKVGNLIGTPVHMIPTRFVNNPIFIPGSSDLVDQIDKIKRKADGTGVGRFLQNNLKGTPEQIGNRLISNAITEGKNALQKVFLGSRKPGAVIYAKKPQGKRYYDAYSKYTEVIDGSNTNISERNDLSQYFHIKREEAKKGTTQIPAFFANYLKSKNENNKLISYAYQTPYLSDDDVFTDTRIFYNSLGNKQSKFASSKKTGIQKIGQLYKPNAKYNTFVIPKDANGLPIKYSDRIDIDGGVDDSNDLRTLLDSLVLAELNSNSIPITRNQKYKGVGVNYTGVPVNMGIYPKYSTTDNDPVTNGNTKGYNIQRGIVTYRELGNTDILNEQGVMKSQTYTSQIGNIQKTLDEIDFITLKIGNASSEYVYFRGTISGLTETFSPSYSQHQGIGMAYPLYTFDSIERTIQFNFKVYSLTPKEHIAAWDRLEFLAHQTMPQGFTGAGATNPPTIRFWLGDLFKGRTAFIETLNYVTDQNFPWEIGLNDPMVECYKLPMIIDVSMTVHLIESYSEVTDGDTMYDFNKPNSYSRTTNPAVAATAVDPNTLPIPRRTRPIPPVTATNRFSAKTNFSVGSPTVPTSLSVPSTPRINIQSGTTNNVQASPQVQNFSNKKTGTTNSTNKKGKIDFSNSPIEGDKVVEIGFGVADDAATASKLAKEDAMNKAKNKFQIIGINNQYLDLQESPIDETNTIQNGKTVVKFRAQYTFMGVNNPERPDKPNLKQYAKDSPERQKAEDDYKAKMDVYKQELDIIREWRAGN